MMFSKCLRIIFLLFPLVYLPLLSDWTVPPRSRDHFSMRSTDSFLCSHTPSSQPARNSAASDNRPPAGFARVRNKTATQSVAILAQFAKLMSSSIPLRVVELAGDVGRGGIGSAAVPTACSGARSAFSGLWSGTGAALAPQGDDTPACLGALSGRAVSARWFGLQRFLCEVLSVCRCAEAGGAADAPARRKHRYIGIPSGRERCPDLWNRSNTLARASKAMCKRIYSLN